MTRKVRYGVERETSNGWGEHLAIFESEDAAIKRLQREREMDTQAVSDGWISQPGKYRIVEVNGRIW